MSREQRLALDALENYIACMKKLRELQRATRPTEPACIYSLLINLSLSPATDFAKLGDYLQLDFRRQLRTIR